MPELLYTNSSSSKQELLCLQHKPGIEFVNGKILEKSSSLETSRVAVQIIYLLQCHAKKSGNAKIYTGGLGYQCFAEEPERVRKPDISAIAIHRLKRFVGDIDLMPIPPDLAIEVIAPAETAFDLEIRIEEYLANNFNLIWIVYPDTHTVVIYRGDGSIIKLHGKDQITGESALPGFSCNVAEFFAHHQCLSQPSR